MKPRSTPPGVCHVPAFQGDVCSRGRNQSQGTRERIPGVGTNCRGRERMFLAKNQVYSRGGLSWRATATREPYQSGRCRHQGTLAAAVAAALTGYSLYS
eukprot:1032362-Prorocentrum_minimum.AAC.1